LKNNFLVEKYEAELFGEQFKEFIRAPDGYFF